MTEQEETPAAELPPEVEIPFHGRTVWVKMPRPEQLLVWQRTLNALSNAADPVGKTGSEVMAALERLRKIVDSILVNKADVAWLDDQMLDGEIGFVELAPFLTAVSEKFAELAEGSAPNREAKRAVKKAARKKTVTK